MPGKRLNGEGSVYQRSSDGRWVGAVTVGFNEVGRPVRKTVSAKTAVAAREKLRSIQRQLDEGLPPPDDRMTVKQLLARWEKDILRHQVSTNTFENYKSLAEHHIEPMLGRKRVSKLMPADVDALVSIKLDEGYSVSTVRRIRASLSQALDQAIRWGVVPRNVVTLTRGPWATRRGGRALSPDEAKLLLKAVEGHRLEAFYVTMLYLGLRPGEALGLRWSAVDLSSGLAAIQAALRREGGMLVIGDVKTASSRRSVNLPAPVIEALRHHKERQEREREAVGSSRVDLDLVFPSEVGTPIDPSNLRRNFDAACERAGVGPLASAPTPAYCGEPHALPEGPLGGRCRCPGPCLNQDDRRRLRSYPRSPERSGSRSHGHRPLLTKV